MDGRASGVGDARLVLVQLMLVWIRRGDQACRATALNQVRQLEWTLRTMITVVGNPPSMTSIAMLWKCIYQAVSFSMDDTLPTALMQLPTASINSFASVEWRPLCELMFCDYGTQLAEVMPRALLTLQQIQSFYLSGMANDPVSGSEIAENVLNDCQLVLMTAEFPFRISSSSASVELAPLTLPATTEP
eukprot:s1984_g10.t1